jgi:hypothetical protein
VFARFVAVAIAAVAAASVAGVARAGFPSLYVNYKTEDCTFSLTNDAGKTVRTILSGAYQVVVATSGTFGDYYVSPDTGLRACKGFVGFRLTGPGVNLTTTLDFGDSSGEILAATFKAGGTYIVQDDHNVAGTKRSFTVSKTGSVPDVGGSPLRGALDASVSSKGKLTLSLKSKAVSSLKQGRWTFSVNDQSKTSGFTIQQLGKSPVTVTNAGFFGFREVTITLKPGRWSFYSPGGAKSSFVVS